MNARTTLAGSLRSRLALAAALALVSVAALGTTASASTATSSATPLERAAARTGPTIVQLSMQWAGTVYDNRNKQYVSTEPIVVGSNCTGFFVNGQGYIGSAGHCVTYDAGIEAALIEQTALTAIKNGYYKEGTTPEAILAASKTDYQVMTHAEPVVTVYIPAQVSGISTSKSLTARVITSKPFDDGDVALLKVDATNTPALPLATSANIVIGEHDISIGYPVEVRKSTDASLSPSYKDGTISSQRTVNDGKFKVYETSAAIGHGMSGGPTINEAGEVLGINSFGPIESDAAFNFIRPSEMLGELLKSQGVENTVDPTQQEYLAGLDAYFAGDRSTALEHFDNVLADVPSHSFALHYRTLALALPAASTSHTFRNVLLAALLLLIAGGGSAALIVRRRGFGGGSAPAPATPASVPTERVPAVPGPAVQAPIRRAPATVVPMGYALVIDTSDERHPIDGELVIGREGADICVDDLEASRRHATIRVQGAGVLELCDLGSANGTYVNDVRVNGAPTVLEAGDVIRVGRSVLRVEATTTAGERLRMRTVVTS